MAHLYGFGALLIAMGCFNGMRVLLAGTDWALRRMYLWLGTLALVLVLMKGETLDQRIAIVALSAVLGAFVGTIFARD